MQLAYLEHDARGEKAAQRDTERERAQCWQTGFVAPSVEYWFMSVGLKLCKAGGKALG